ncbi:MAG: heavy-metal-associated domain-containing protein [Candidatus Competibacteraceae bacterium]
MELEFWVQNIKCNGCASAIRNGLGKYPQVRDVQVDVPTGQVTVTTDNNIRAELGVALRDLGYPEKAA